MSLKRSDGNQSPVQKTMMVLSIVMTVVYIALAVGVYLNAYSFKGLEPQFTQMFAAILLMYGLFRGWKTWDTYFND